MKDASDAIKASAKGSDNDENAKQAYGRDRDTRWGRTYDRVQANSFDDVHYEREIWADDDEWAENGNGYAEESADADEEAASEKKEDEVKTTTTITVKQPDVKAEADPLAKVEKSLDAVAKGSSEIHGKADVHVPHVPATSYIPQSQGYGQVQSYGQNLGYG